MPSELNLTDQDYSLLAKWLVFYRELDDESRKPATDAQARFVRVFRGTAKPASEHEWAYLRYRAMKSQGKLAEYEQRQQSSLNDGFGEGMPTLNW